MKFRLEIDCDSAAFGDDDGHRAAELARILAHLVANWCGAMNAGTLRDANGNRVGFARFEPEGAK